MSYVMSKMMHKKKYPLEHQPTEEKFKKLKRKYEHKDLTFEQYESFLSGDDAAYSLVTEFEFYDDSFLTRGQFLNWLLEKRLNDGRII